MLRHVVSVLSLAALARAAISVDWVSDPVQCDQVNASWSSDDGLVGMYMYATYVGTKMVGAIGKSGSKAAPANWNATSGVQPWGVDWPATVSLYLQAEDSLGNLAESDAREIGASDITSCFDYWATEVEVDIEATATTSATSTTVAQTSSTASPTPTPTAIATAVTTTTAQSTSKSTSTTPPASPATTVEEVTKVAVSPVSAVATTTSDDNSPPTMQTANDDTGDMTTSGAEAEAVTTTAATLATEAVTTSATTLSSSSSDSATLSSTSIRWPGPTAAVVSGGSTASSVGGVLSSSTSSSVATTSAVNLGQPARPTSSALDPVSAAAPSSTSSHTALIAGTVMGSVAAIIVLTSVALYLRRRQSCLSPVPTFDSMTEAGTALAGTQVMNERTNSGAASHVSPGRVHTARRIDDGPYRNPFEDHSERTPLALGRTLSYPLTGLPEPQSEANYQMVDRGY